MDKNKLKVDVLYATATFKEAFEELSKKNPEGEPIAAIMGLAIVLGLTIGAYEKFNRKKVPMRQIDAVIRENIPRGKKEADKVKKGGS